MRAFMILTALLLAVLLVGCRYSTGEHLLPVTPFPDYVVEFHGGAGSEYGAGFFPGNVLFGPDPAATEFSPSNSEQMLRSLGRGGYIVLQFDDGGIVDSLGDDFVIFENAFINRFTNLPYREFGIVAVSEDGTNWREFPYDSAGNGLAGGTPTGAFVQGQSELQRAGGDRFDLATVAMPHARFLKITDADTLVADEGDSFDLDAVVVLHGENGP